jgi:hypothetical protein
MTPLGSRKLQQVWHFLLLTFASVGERIEEKKNTRYGESYDIQEKENRGFFFFNSFLKIFCFFFLLVFFMLFPYFFFQFIQQLICFGCLLLEISLVDLFWLAIYKDIMILRKKYITWLMLDLNK